jgi:phospholipid/cholesterol/gamma-HCH transport system permease protein
VTPGPSADLAGVAPPWTLDPARPEEGTLCLRLRGRWTMEGRLPAAAEVERVIVSGAPVRRLTFESGDLTGWDTGLLTLLRGVFAVAERAGIAVEPAGLPDGVRRLLRLAGAVPPRQPDRVAPRSSWLARLGTATLRTGDEVSAMLAFVGEVVRALGALLTFRAHVPRAEFWLLVQEVGARALPITALVGVLIGVIFAFVGAVQLRQFGAQLYVADLVGIAVAREVGALITAIVLAGRTGSAFAAQLGTMTVNEEIDALTTMGIAPMQFLVVPRIVALVLMTPLLTLYADLLGMLGGALVGIGMLDIAPVAYVNRSVEALGIADFVMGLVKASVFGALIAFAGCFRGMRSGRSAAAVGEATTSAVVTCIVLIIVADGVLTVVYNALGY